MKTVSQSASDPLKPSSQTRAFSNKTLQGNWYEDRWGEPEELRWDDRVAHVRRFEPELSIGLPMSAAQFPAAPLTTLKHFSSPQTWRTQTVDVPQDPAVPYVRKASISTDTTKGHMDSCLHMKLAPKRNVAIVNHLNMRQTIWADRKTADAPETGFGATLPRHSGAEFQSDWTTTTQHFYVDKANLAKTTRPDIYCQPRKTTFCSTGKLERDSYTTTKVEDKFAGRAGRRGELVRHPGEAGSVYGVSTFVDDYATWGTKLQGVPLSETEANKTTRYFDA